MPTIYCSSDTSLYNGGDARSSVSYQREEWPTAHPSIPLWMSCAFSNDQSHRQTQISGVSYESMSKLLGPPNVVDDPDKVKHAWSGYIYAANIDWPCPAHPLRCRIWDWKDSGDEGTWSLWCESPIDIETLVRLFERIRV